MNQWQGVTYAAGAACAARYGPITANPYRNSPFGHFKTLEKLWDEGYKYERRKMERRKRGVHPRNPGKRTRVK